MAKSTTRSSPVKKIPARWQAWKAFEPFSTQEQNRNYHELQLTRAALTAGTWRPGYALVQPPQPAATTPPSRKRKRESASTEGSSLASSDRPKRSPKAPSRYRDAIETPSNSDKSGERAVKKRKTTTASASSSATSSAPPTPPKSQPKPAKAAKRVGATAAPGAPFGEPFTEQEYAWVHQLKTEAGVSRTWKDIARYMNAIQSHQRTGGAFQASYSRTVATAARRNGGVVPNVYTNHGPHAPVPALPQ